VLFLSYQKTIFKNQILKNMQAGTTNIKYVFILNLLGFVANFEGYYPRFGLALVDFDH